MRQVGLLPEDHRERDGRVVGRGVADEPAVADVAVVGLGRQRAGLARHLDGQVALALACRGRSPLAVPMRVVSSIIRPTSRATAGVNDRGAGRRRQRERAAVAGRRRARSSGGAGISPRLAIVAASSAPCRGDSVECQNPAAARANSRRSSGIVDVRRLDRDVERDGLAEAESVADPGQALGRQVLAWPAWR